MNKFRQAGFIDYNGHLEVHSSLLSVVLAEQPRTVRSPSDFSVSE
jgi:CRP/FNR family cyclic AMP-dependent transcriptional regulator